MWNGTVREDPPVGSAPGTLGDPISMTGGSITAECEFYMASVSGESISDFVKIAGSTTRTLNVILDADQVANPGRFSMVIPHDIYTAEIPLDATTLPVVLIYIKIAVGSTEMRVGRMLIAIRRERTDRRLIANADYVRRHARQFLDSVRRLCACPAIRQTKLHAQQQLLRKAMSMR